MAEHAFILTHYGFKIKHKRRWAAWILSPYSCKLKRWYQVLVE